MIAPSQTAPRVFVDRVTKLFKSSSGLGLRRNSLIQVLHCVSFSADEGEIVALLGPNGSGKTTLLRLLATLLLPDAGRVWVNGYDSTIDGTAIRRRVGYANANERSFYGRLTVRENLEFFAALEEVERSQRRDRIAYLISTLGLENWVGTQAVCLSSGTVQRLAIARALLKSPEVLLLDEPTRSLDLKGTRALWSLLHQLAGEGVTVVLATHNLDEATAEADSLALLNAGSLVLHQRSQNQRFEEEFRAAFDDTSPADLAGPPGRSRTS